MIYIINALLVVSVLFTFGYFIVFYFTIAFYIFAKEGAMRTIFAMLFWPYLLIYFLNDIKSPALKRAREVGVKCCISIAMAIVISIIRNGIV